MPKISVIEGLSLPGSPSRENDDALGASGSVAFVLDGATGLGDTPLLPGTSDAAWVAHTARDLLVQHGAGAGGDLRSLIRVAAEGVRARFEAQRLREPEGRWEMPWATLCLIGVEPGRLNIAYVGDSRALIETANDEVHNFGMGATRSEMETRLAAKMIAAKKNQALGVDSIRATVLPELKRARDQVNTRDGYWLMGIEPDVAKHATVTSLTLDGPATVLLTTDGFYALADDYKRYGDRELIATAQTVGLKILARELRHIEDEDPDGERYPRMKKSDDATALLLRVEP